MNQKIIEEKLDELRLQMNYLCYDKEILSKFSGVWKAFYELEAALNSSFDSKRAPSQLERFCVFLGKRGVLDSMFTNEHLIEEFFKT